MKVAIFAGGTGGHIFPGISIAEKFSKEEVIFFCSSRKLEKEIFSNIGYRAIHLNIEGFRGKSLTQKILWPLKLVNCCLKAFALAKKYKVDRVLLMGGYVSIIGWILSKVKKLKLYIHEQNSILGSANKLAYKSSITIFTSHLLNLPNEKLTGNPIRNNFLNKNYDANENRNKVLIFGGSQGSRYFVENLASTLDSIIKESQIIFQTGGNQPKFKSDNIVYKEFIDDLPSLFDEVKFVICRSGATTVAEIQSYGMPAIFIPLKNSIDNHQLLNAKAACLEGGGMVVEEGESTTEDLIAAINELQSSDLSQMSKKMKKDIHFEAAEIIANEIKQN